jgi:FtsP/CotA-like multicopper oxidase with cupredoxin domain
VPIHTLDGTLLAEPVDGPDRLPSAPGAPVRLRLVDTDDGPHVLTVRGTPFRIAAVDGGDLADPAATTGRLSIPAGGRYDLVFTLPDGPVALDVDGRTAVRWGDGEPPQDGPQPLIDITRYPTSAPSPLGPAPRFDVEQTLVLDRTLGFLDGVPAQLYPVDGLVWPDIPPTVVHEGDLVRFAVVNRGSEPHPMHPHGHAVLVLSRDGVPASGPLWTDSFEVGPGEVWEVALVADHPGIWADHCHNLDHAAAGMVLHLVYAGVTDPFAVGSDTGNTPE